jgi:hypothetical protein
LISISSIPHTASHWMRKLSKSLSLVSRFSVRICKPKGLYPLISVSHKLDTFQNLMVSLVTVMRIMTWIRSFNWNAINLRAKHHPHLQILSSVLQKSINKTLRKWMELVRTSHSLETAALRDLSLNPNLIWDLLCKSYKSWFKSYKITNFRIRIRRINCCKWWYHTTITQKTFKMIPTSSRKKLRGTNKPFRRCG